MTRRLPLPHAATGPAGEHRQPARAAKRALAAAVLAVAAIAGCAKGDIIGTGGTGGVAGGHAGGGSGNGGTTGVTIAVTTQVPQSPDAASISRVVGCDGGDGCTCPPFNLAVLGKPGKWGANPSGDPDTALQDWLNSSSAGTARVDNFTQRVALTADFLSTYNVIILASLSEDSNVGPWWTFTDAEAAAFRAWVEAGGGVIALTGYSSGNEMSPVNQLIGFSGVSYNNDGVWGACVDWQICGCTHSNTVSDWNRADPAIANLSTGVTLVGFQNGHSIASPADGHVAATVDGKNALVGKLAGQGRVLAFGDEWITYTSQWTGAGDPSGTDPNCAGFLPQDKYQIAQLWYNMIRWSQPTANCFTIVDTYVPITIW